MPEGHADAAANAPAFERVFDEAVEALRNGDREQAGLRLWGTLGELDGVDDDEVRRSLASQLANVCWLLGFDDLALFALDVAIPLGEELGDVRGLENDSLTLGNVQSRLGNLAEAEVAWRLVDEVGVLNGDFANAASAATNLGGQLAQEGYLAEAFDLLQRSLEYLEREPFAATELNTRFLLLQLLDMQGADHSRVLDAAEPIGALADQLPQPHRARVAEIVEGALADRPERRAEFDWLLEGV
jgi:tetratricopeptide (TPR) repeat protein